MNNLSYIPSPSFSTINLGFFHIHIYAITMLIAIVVGGKITYERYKKKGGITASLLDPLIFAIIFGIIFARLYHVFTDYSDYLLSPNNFIKILYVWNGGLSIWGAIAGGVFGAYIGCKHEGINLIPILDAVAFALPIAQAIGRIGNYFNQELFGSPTTLPWGLKVSDSITINTGNIVGTYFHPTFLYEIIWCLLIALVIKKLEKKYNFEYGQSFYFYIFLYCLGRLWIEALRIDKSPFVFGIRFNEYISFIVCIFGLVLFIMSRRKNSEKKIVEILEDTNLTSEHHFTIKPNTTKKDIKKFKTVNKKKSLKNRRDFR